MFLYLFENDEHETGIDVHEDANERVEQDEFDEDPMVVVVNEYVEFVIKLPVVVYAEL